jgi:hypothetical protein
MNQRGSLRSTLASLALTGLPFVLCLSPAALFGQAPASEPASGSSSAPASAPAVAAPQRPELGTDRPGLGDATGIVGPGILQIELGSTFTGVAGARTLTIPETLFRFGLSDRIELRLGAALTRAAAGGEAVIGPTGLTAAVKAKILSEDKSGIDFTILPVLALVDGEAAVDPIVEFLFGKGLPADLGLSLAANLAAPKAGDARLLEISGAAALDRDLVENLNAFAEIFTAVTSGGGAAEVATVVDAGVTLLLDDDLQLDLSGGVGLSAGADDFFVSVGLVTRAFLGARWRAPVAARPGSLP